MCDPFFDENCDPNADKAEKETKMQGDGDDGDMDDMEKMMSPLTGQLTYLVVAGIACTKAGMDLFRYRSDADYYDAGEDPYSWNPWKLANLIEQYTDLSVWGVLFIFQLLSTFGVLSGLNVVIWMWAGAIAGLIYMVTHIFRFMAYDAVAKSDSDVSGAEAIASAIEMDTMYAIAAGSAFALPLLMEYPNWMYA